MFNKASAQALGFVYLQVNRLAGANHYLSDGLTVCHGAKVRLWARGGTTIGTTFATGANPRMRTADVLAHERVHMDQWERHGLTFIFRYVAAGRNPLTHKFEQEAGLKRGGYRTSDE